MHLISSCENASVMQYLLDGKGFYCGVAFAVGRYILPNCNTYMSIILVLGCHSTGTLRFLFASTLLQFTQAGSEGLLLWCGSSCWASDATKLQHI